VNRRIPPKAGDLVIWKDGSIGILIERFDIYDTKSRGGYPSWSWIIEFPKDCPDNYNKTWGEAENNLINGCAAEKIIPC
jgi:hypothetical protein